MAITIVLLILLTIAVTAAYFVIGRKRRIMVFDLDPEQLPNIGEALPLIAGITGGMVSSGNSTEIFQNGDIFDAMLEDIDAARQHVHLETFVWKKGALERAFVDRLVAKAEQGVKVRVLIDSVGAMEADESQLHRLRRSGAELAEYRPISWVNLSRFNNRTHRKLLIVDGDVGYAMGHGIADEWLGNAQDENHWRDTGIRLRGPVVGPLQSVFLQDWVEASGRIPSDERCFPSQEATGTAVAHVVSSTGDAKSSVALLYKLAIASARREIIIQNPYFIPNPQVPKLLCKMAERGVQVHLMIPGAHTDSPFVRRAGFNLYPLLLRSGVHIHEYQPTLLHQKIVIIDGLWSHVGSTNFDERSLALNAEIGVGILDESVAAQLKSAFEEDLKESHELQLDTWERRPVLQKCLDWSAYQLHGQL